jgi:hypothetical protein
MFLSAIDSIAQLNNYDFTRDNYEFRCEFESKSKTKFSLQLIEMYAHRNYVRFDFQKRVREWLERLSSQFQDICFAASSTCYQCSIFSFWAYVTSLRRRSWSSVSQKCTSLVFYWMLLLMWKRKFWSKSLIVLSFFFEFCERVIFISFMCWSAISKLEYSFSILSHCWQCW